MDEAAGRPDDAPLRRQFGEEEFFEALYARSVVLVPSAEPDLTPAGDMAAIREEVRAWARREGITPEPSASFLARMALATYQFRPTTVSHWEQVVITHAIVGDRRWRAHFEVRTPSWGLDEALRADAPYCPSGGAQRPRDVGGLPHCEQ